MSLRPKKINFDKLFTEFKSDLEKIYNFSGLDRVSGMNMFQSVYDMCTATPKPYTEKLFCAIAYFLEEYTMRKKRVSENGSILDHDDIVNAYAKEWSHYSLASDYSSRICDYLNKIMLKVKDTGGIPASEKRKTVGDGKYRRQTVQALAYLIWKERVVDSIKKFQDRLMYQIFEMIRRDRDGEDVVPDVVAEAIQSLGILNSLTDHPLRLYIEEFEIPYLKHTKLYYEREAADIISSATISQYMKKACQRLEQEAARNSKYCHISSHITMIKECEKQYVAVHQSRIHTEFEAMISNERYEDCSMAYNLLSRITSGVNPLLEIFEQYITQIGKDLISRMGTGILKDPREYVESLMSLHSKYMTVCQRVFSNDSAFIAAVDKAFRTIVNDPSTNPAAHSPEVLARYCDVLLKKNQKSGISEQDIEDKMNSMIILFKYIDDKDVYQKFYSRLLAKRLIYGSSVSNDAEENMISRLKTTCGVEYTSKLQRMFTDITVSADINSSFSDYLKQKTLNLGVDFSILVLTAGAWPLTQVSATDFQLPSELEKSVSYFESFYNDHHSGRKLTWLWHLSKADAKLGYLDKRYEFSVSLYQLGVLLLFNTIDMLTFKEICEHTRLNEQELKRVLKPLIDLAAFIISPTGSLNESTEIKLNMEFSNKRTKIKISSSLQSDSPQETDATRRAVDEDRKLYLQEIIDQAKSRFTPSVPMIKKCIEQLLDKQYLERSIENRDKYVYIA
ncbi:9696_t:CDS:10 [Ambispora gerdemannii]|uniref:Cullin-5 n=1 Tax=Ambispora gerdemannii TaxID=144530 RepID=A0A9N8V4W7_9GLOM|nr:9696_t:CDS:10 [Ambispora gerdemannii]